MCNTGRNRQSVMKRAPMNGINVCERVFVSEMNIFSTCFNFLTIYQVGGLHYVFSYEQYCHLRTMVTSFAA